MSLDKLPRLWGRVSQSLPGLSLVIALMIATWMTQTVGAEQPEPDNKPLPIVTLPEAALQAPAALMPGAMPAAGNSKLDDGLVHAAQREQDATVDASPFLEESSLRIADGLVQTRVIATAGEFTEAQRVIAAAGGLVTYSIETDSVMQAWLPLDSLQALAQEASLAYISAPSYAVELNIDTVAAQTEGFAALNGQAWRNVGYDGSGVKIAIIDSSFGGYKNLLGSELPANVTVQNFVDGENNNDIGSSTSVHGTACAEIAADIVPGASFYLIKVSTDLDLAQAVDYAISHGVDVISTSIAWYNVTPGDGSGYFDNLVKQARDNGIIWFTAGGNDRENHWGGEFNDPDGDGFHNFSSTQEVNYYGPGNGGAYQIGPGTLISVFVRWDDWQVTNQDYVLYIGRWNGSTWEIVGSSD
ncbi:MAG: S8 family serine peptidase, partial [Candidatus Promineifilaceae bacterium]|nr:S8 family serine peptidase [Candidatus Promineifilaceae bacterium]